MREEKGSKFRRWIASTGKAKKVKKMARKKRQSGRMGAKERWMFRGLVEVSWSADS